ncbi:TPA: hypothetical protein JD340_24705 [Citrobacter freundii]|nr:hypothetical protein [Citrobacter freundii]
MTVAGKKHPFKKRTDSIRSIKNTRSAIGLFLMWNFLLKFSAERSIVKRCIFHGINIDTIGIK